jgi:hypothetical protein
VNRAELIELHNELSERGRRMMVHKNHDYAGSEGDDPFANFRVSEVLGVQKELMLLCRVMDKIQRLKTYIRAGELHVKGEGWQDACLDILNYSVLLYGMLLEDQEKDRAKAIEAREAVCGDVDRMWVPANGPDH